MAEISDAVSAALSVFDPLLRQKPSDAPTITPLATAVSTAAPTPKVAAGDLKPIIRPNGEAYVPRKLTAHSTTDVEFIRTAYAKRMPVLLYGPPGTGKTALVEAAMTDVVTILGSGETEAADFIGSWVQRTDGLYEWVDGPLIVAAEKGLPFLVDEIAMIDARVMSSNLYPVMDGRNEIRVTANPARGTVKVADGFMVFGACNPNVPGAVMSDALLSRFRLHVEVETDWDLAKKLGIGPKIITVARNLAAKAKAQEIVAAPQLRELLTFKECVETFGEKVAIANFIGQARIEDRPLYTEAVQSTFGVQSDPLTF